MIHQVQVKQFIVLFQILVTLTDLLERSKPDYVSVLHYLGTHHSVDS